MVDGDENPECGAAVAVDAGEEVDWRRRSSSRPDAARVREHGALDLAGAGTALRGREAGRAGLPNSCKQIEGEIDAVTFCVLFDVAEDVGELEGYAGLFGELFGAGVGVAEDADADEADDRGYEVAVAVEVVRRWRRSGLASLRNSWGSRSMVVPWTSSSRSASGMLEALLGVAEGDEDGVVGGASGCGAARQASSQEDMTVRRASMGMDSSSAMSSARRMKA